MLYNLQDPLSRERFVARANHFLKKGVMVELTDKS